MACAVSASTPACAKATRGMVKIGIDSKTPMASAAITLRRKFGSSTMPAKENFRWRSALKIPQ